MKPEQIAILVLVSVIVLWAGAGLLGLIEGTLDGIRQVRELTQARRNALRKNINEIICVLSTMDDPMLSRALHDSIIKYRSLS